MSRGSLMGYGGCLAYSFRNIQLNSPPMNAQQPRCSQKNWNGYPSGYGAGMIWKDISTQCISHAQMQSGTIHLNTLFTSIRSKARKGRKKCPKIMTMLTANQEPFSRR